MSDFNINNGDVTEITGNGPRPGGDDVNVILEVQESAITLEWICERIDSVIKDNEHIKEALAGFKNHGDISGSLGILVNAREETNRQTLRLLEKMYNDLTAKSSVANSTEASPSGLLKDFDINHAIELMDSDDIADFLSNILSSPNRAAGVLKDINVNHVLGLMDSEDIPEFLQKLAGISDED